MSSEEKNSKYQKFSFRGFSGSGQRFLNILITYISKYCKLNTEFAERRFFDHFNGGLMSLTTEVIC